FPSWPPAGAPLEKRLIATSAMRATMAIPANAHGAIAANPVAAGAARTGAVVASDGRFDPAATPTGVPHLWQNLAPGVSSAPHCAHFTPVRAAPHSLQNFPRALAPQLGQVTGEASAMGP